MATTPLALTSSRQNSAMVRVAGADKVSRADKCSG